MATKKKAAAKAVKKEGPVAVIKSVHIIKKKDLTTTGTTCPLDPSFLAGKLVIKKLKTGDLHIALHPPK